MARSSAVRRRLALLLALAAGACAQPMPPPGGPPDTKVPQLVKVEPESGAVNVRPRAIVLTFDEVISERSTGGGTAGSASNVLVSPVSGETTVAWSRDQLYIRPSKGFRPNAVYTVTLLPGIADLRNNISKVSRTIVFATGSEIPDTRIRGRAFDWVKGIPVTKGYVEAIRTADSTVYIAITDSTGGFELRALPPGAYRLKGVVDNNNNRRLEPREPWAEVPLTLADTAQAELLAFVHDTLGPRVQGLAVQDSLTIKLTFDQPLLPELSLAPALFALATADSQPVPIARVLTPAVADSLAKVEAARMADSLAKADTTQRTAPRDSTAKGAAPPAKPAVPAAAPAGPPRGAKPDSAATPPPKPSKPSPLTELVLKLERPLAPGTRYALALVEVRGLLGASRPSTRSFITAVKRDTTAAADSTRRAAPARRRGATPPDSTRKPPR